MQSLCRRFKAAELNHRSQSSELRTVELFLIHVADPPPTDI
jgi:hypothetical protein